MFAPASSGKSSPPIQTPITLKGPSQNPSPSVSGLVTLVPVASSAPFGNPSLSMSQAVEFSSGEHPSNESEPLAISSTSRKLSLSSSGSSLSPIPSPSLSFHSSGSVGKASGPASHMRTSSIVTEIGPSQ